MIEAAKQDWNPGAYARFRGLRLRPALDLLMQIRKVPGGDVVDLGCGDGAAAGSLAARFPKRRIIGVDASANMLEKARGYAEIVLSDIAVWKPVSPPAVIFANAVLHWLGDHGTLLPGLAGTLAPGGTLAVQMPQQFQAPSHRFLRDIAASMFPGRFDFAHYVPPVARASDYHAMLAELGEVNAWETDYVQRLEPCDGQHPVHAFTAATAMRPIAAKLDAGELATFAAAYDQALGAAYPKQADGSVLFPFRRVFFILVVG